MYVYIYDIYLANHISYLLPVLWLLKNISRICIYLCIYLSNVVDLFSLIAIYISISTIYVRLYLPICIHYIWMDARIRYD